MRISPVKYVTFTCPVCGTSIKFGITTNYDERINLFKIMDELVCPKCKEDLSRDATNSLTAITNYNDAVANILSMQEDPDIELG